MYQVFETSSFNNAIFIGLCFLAHWAYQYRRRRLSPLPPGPRRWPIIKNAFSIPITHAHIFYKGLGEELGTKILYLEAFGKSILVINDMKIAHDLLVKRSSCYSSRPHLPMLTEVVGFQKFFGLMPYGDNWRIHRRIFEQYFSEKHLLRIQDRVLGFIRKGFLPNLLEVPEEFHEHCRHVIGGLSVSFAYGLPVRSRNDPFVKYSEKVLTQMPAMMAPGNYLVNIIPALKYIPGWIPGAGFKRFAAEVRKDLDKLLEDPFRATLEAMGNDTALPSLVSESMEQLHGSPDFKQQAQYLKQTAVQVFAAFSETTTAAVVTFILAMLKHPDVQRKAQDEVDVVLGPGRLPEFSDIPRLHYLSAVMKEVLRWNPILPMGLPHSTSNEDEYMGYHIPKNCTVMANAYAMLHDENVFPNPEEFKPERFLIKDQAMENELPNPEILMTFGFGRRICPGSHIALSIMYIMAGSILSLFDISPALDPKGRPIGVVPEFTTASVASEPLPFPCKLTPRKGKDVKDMLKEYLDTETM